MFHNHLPLEKDMALYFWEPWIPFIWTNLNLLHQRMLCAKFGWNWPGGTWDNENLKSLQTGQVDRQADRQIDRRTGWNQYTLQNFVCRGYKYIYIYEWSFIENTFSYQFSNKRPTGLKGHPSFRDFTLTTCQRGTYLHINSPIIIINKNQQLYRKAAS